LKKRLSLSPTSISSKAQQTLTNTVDPLSPSSTDCSDCTLASSCSLPIISQLSSTPPSTIGISPTRFERSEVSKQYSNEDPSICSIEVRLRAPTAATLSKQQQANAVAAAYHLKEAQAQAEALAEAHRGMVMDGGGGSSGGSGSDDCNLMMIGSRDNSHCYNHLNTNTNANANALYEAKLKQQQYAMKNGNILSSLDESIEWREINEIMESFGGGICRESVFTDQYEPRVAVYLRDRRSKALTLQLNNGTATAAAVAASSPPVNGNTPCACYSRTTATDGDGDGDGVATATDSIDSKHFLALATAAAAQTGDGPGDGSAEPVAVPPASRRVSRQYAAAAVAPPNAHVQLLGTQTAAAAALQLESHSSSSRSLPSDGCVHGTCSCAAADDHLLSSSLVSLSPRHHNTTTNRCYRCGHDHQQHFYSNNNNTVAETAATTNASEEMILISSLSAASKRCSPTITTTNDGVGAVQPQSSVSTLNSSNARLTIIKSSTITASNNNNNNNNKSNNNPHKSINNTSLLLSSSYPSGTVTSSAIALQPRASYRSCCDSTHRYHHNTHAHAHVQAANTASAACVHQTNVVVAAAAANANASSLNCTSCCMRPLAESIKTIAVPLVASVSTSAAAGGGGYHKNNYNGNHQVTTSASSNRRQSSKYHHHRHYSPNRSRSSSSTTTTTSAVANWLNVSVGVPNPRAKEIATVLESHGFDSVKHMSTLDRAAMHEIGLDKSTQHQIGTYLDNYPGQTPLSANSFTYVSDWLNSLELEDYLGHFINGGLTSMLIVLALDPSAKHLKSLGITLLGHQKRILESLKEAKLERRLRVAERINAETAAVAAAELEAEGTDSGQESRSTAPSSSCASRHKSQMLMPYAHHSKGHHQQPHSSSSIIIGGQPTEWRHSSSTLIEECVSYSAHYLGSMEISNIEGTEDSRRAMIKLKKGIREIAKVPQVLLEISVAGVRVLDATTKQLTVEHDITRIQIVCQDERDLNCFAYISQDGDKHFCHVFCVLTADVATEIIITLGQAFEVCYRLANGTYRSDGADPIVINPLL
uniref:RING-type domain-containing protein n=1 Tax=Anisakis simplex TaxID=6269 RepID=A0A0M3IYH4_ANISI